MTIRIHHDSPPSSGRVRYEETFASTFEEKDRVIDVLLGEIRDLGLRDPQEAFRVRLCLDEVIQNAIVHGNAGDAAKRVSVRLLEGSGCWTLEVSDEGEGFSEERIPDLAAPGALLRDHGRGLWILREYMDRVAYYNGGRTAVIWRATQPARGPAG